MDFYHDDNDCDLLLDLILCPIEGLNREHPNNLYMRFQTKANQ